MFSKEYKLHQHISKMHMTVPQVHNRFITKATSDPNYIFEM